MTDNTQTPQDAHDKTVQTPSIDHAAIDESITLRQEVSGIGAILRTQPFWVFVAIFAIGVVMTFVSDAFLTERNMFNITRNMAFFGIMALGMSAVICTAGIDLSVGSLMGLCAINLALVLQAGWGVEVGFLACMFTAAVVGFINGVLIAYVRLAPFVVTLGMLAMSRSIAMVISNNKMVYEFGPDQDLFEQIGGGSLLGVPNVVWVLTAMTLFFLWVWRYSQWGRWVIAIGGNAHAAKLSGIPVERVIVSVYMVCSMCTGVAAFMFIGYTGSATNGMGATYELNVIAASVIGGANLMGGVVYALGAPIGAALVELIRNSLLLAGIPALWQQFFVGLFLILAVLLEQLRNRGGK
ncbi:ABC transporter permease [Antarctobacter heliothermus]|uniref:Ribose transport system permease protein n=1 Tax=Antarctobacter heliothermus TaxID=74033 RepID=A0A239EZR4_9RHOB|nr:ABC transporter permease [Antarctobacter heliothermus]SNS50085.1 ribose transport system permease protein [Antarctobacter heliothermus]